MSKYSHHSAAAIAIPMHAATTTPVVTPCSAPTPIATIDSPSAMITISPWRSAKWPGSSRHPPGSITSGPAMSNPSAAAHSRPWSRPSANDAPTSSPVPSAVLASRPQTARRNPGSSRLAIRNRPICANRTSA